MPISLFFQTNLQPDDNLSWPILSSAGILGKPRLKCSYSRQSHHDATRQSTRPPRRTTILPPNRYSKRTPTVSSSSPSNMKTSGGCTKRPKRPFGLPRRLTSLLIPQTGTDTSQRSSTSYPTSWLFSRHLMASSMKILAATLPQRSHYLKPNASTAFRLPSRTSIAKHTHS